MELSTASVAHDLVTHVDDNGPRAFMLSPSIDYGDENDSSGVVTLPNIEEGSPYLIDMATDCLLTETMALSKQVNESLPSSAISLHSYSQVLPSVASECLHNYSQPIDLPLVGAKTEVLHNYSQPWPQNTDSFTSVHNYCINNDVTDQLKDLQPHNEVKIYKLSKADNSNESNEQPVISLKLQLVDSYVCQWRDCGAGFTTTQALVEHVGDHITAQQCGIYQCLWKNCSRNEVHFERRYKLVQHMRIHTAERPHKCSLCDVEFSSAEGLTKHQRVHTGEKPYPCTHPGCTKAFKNSGDRSRHLKYHRVKYAYPCKVIGCDKLYTDPGSLRKHVKSKHAAGSLQSQTGPTVEKRIQTATLVSASGLETKLDVNELEFSDVNGTLYCEDSMLMASAGIVSPKKVKSVSTSPNDGLDMPIIDLGNTEPTSHNWITFNPLDNT